MTTKEIREAIEEHENAIEDLQRKYLQAHGWHYTCQCPGSLWMWEKKLDDGRTMLVGASTALELQMEESAEDELEEDFA